jgi:hypothetical protein
MVTRRIADRPSLRRRGARNPPREIDIFVDSTGTRFHPDKGLANFISRFELQLRISRRAGLPATDFTPTPGSPTQFRSLNCNLEFRATRALVAEFRSLNCNLEFSSARGFRQREQTGSPSRTVQLSHAQFDAEGFAVERRRS